MSAIAKTPKPPYYAVIFTNLQSEQLDGYAEMAERMGKLAAGQPGYLGFESARDSVGIAISYWDSLEAIAAWKQNAEHLQAQARGKDQWYTHYTTRICLVEREYSNLS